MKTTTILFIFLLSFLISCGDTITNGSDDENENGDQNFELIHFFYFNEDMPNDTPLESYDAWYSSETGAFLSFRSSMEGYPLEESHELRRLASMERRNQPTIINYRPDGNNELQYNSEDMRGLQIRNPFAGDAGENMLTLNIPTLNYQNIQTSFAVLNEGGANQIQVEYITTSSATEWTTLGLEESIYDIDDQYRLITLDFSEIEEVNNNLNFRVRIRFLDANDSSDPDGDIYRVTFNNIAVDGVAQE